MNYEEFVSAVETEVKIKLREDEFAEINKIMKNNGKWRHGITIRKEGREEAPTIYLEEYYDSYRKGDALEQITEDLLLFYRNMEWKPDIAPESVTEYQGVKWRIVPKLINREKNETLLRELPFAMWMDLAVTFYVLIDASPKGTTTMTICRSHLEKWGVTPEQLYDAAMLNAACLLPAKLVPVSQVIREFSGRGTEEEVNLLEGGEAADCMYVLSNQIRCFGAVCIVYPHVAEMIGHLLAENYYVLPSSVHETIIVPESGGVAREAFREMICDVNATQVEEEDVLSGHAYYYDRKKGEFSL